MPTYQEYCEHMKIKKAQPMGESAFNALIKAGFNPITSEWVK